MPQTPTFLPEAPENPEDVFDVVIVSGDAYVDHPAFGAALIGRYLVTGTEADYQRFEAKVRTVLRSFAVTGIKGYLARHYFVEVPAEAPRDDRYALRSEGTALAVEPEQRRAQVALQTTEPVTLVRAS